MVLQNKVSSHIKTIEHFIWDNVVGMNNNTEVVFDNIEERILSEIKEAHYSIFVSVAWFTNKKLFGALLEKAKKNCYVSIIIQLDEINSQSGIDYSQIQIGRSECFKISKDAQLLHDKFCVIDFQKVITGSYNWTYKASHNSENILILNDPSVATQYISRFEQQKAKFCQPVNQQKTSSFTTLNNVNNSSIDINSTKRRTLTESEPSTRQCPSCYRKIEYQSIFCQYCGYDIHNKLDLIEVSVICKKCSRRQDDALNDATNSNYCTYCGSNELKWIPRFKCLIK